MKTFKNKISWIIIFSLIISFIFPVNTFAENDDSQTYSVKVRIEGHDSTFVSPTTVEIDSLDLSEYPGIEKPASEYNSLKPIHAIVHALEKSGIDPKDPNKFHVGFGGNYIHMINGLREFAEGPASGWMYWVDNQYAPSGVGEYEITDGQEVVVFYVENYMENVYSWFDKSSLSVDQDEIFELTLKGNSDAWGGGTASGVEGATILVNDKEYVQEGEIVKTDGNGKASLRIEEPGTYHISAAKKNSAGENILTRPYASVTVEKSEEINTIQSIEQVDDIQVDYGTDKSDVISLFPKATNIVDSLGNKHSVNLNWSIGNYSANSSGEYTAIASFKLPEGVNQTDPETLLELSAKVLVKEKPVTTPLSLDDAIDKVVRFYENNNPGNPDGDWEAYIGLWGVGHVLNKNYVWESVDPGFGANINGNETLRYGYSLLGLGQDISNIWGGRNLFAELAGQQKEDGSFTTLGKELFAILLLDAGEKMGADVGTWNGESRQKAIDSLLRQQNANGSFGFFSHLDYTGWALIALSEYQGDKKVDQAIENAVKFLKDSQGDNGGFHDNSMWGSGENSNSNACVIQGLVAIGEDLLSSESQWIKNGNTVVDALLKFQHEDGSFWWEEDSKGSVGMATKQALVALSDLKNQKSTWHRLGEEIYLSSVGEKDVEDLISNINKLPDIKTITFDHKQEVMKIYNMYLQLPEEYREKVTNIDTLMQIKEKIDQIEETIESINDRIWALPGDVNDITLEHKSAVLEIIKSYEKLSAADKKYIEYYQEVLDAKSAIDKLETKKVQDLTDKGSGIFVQDKDNILPAGTYIVVEQLKEGEDYNASKALIENKLKDKIMLQLFEIDLLKDGAKHFFDGTVQVRIPIPKDYLGEDLKIYKILPDDTLKDMNATIEDGMLVFETDSFSKFALVGTAKDSGKSPDTNPDNQPNEKGSNTDTKPNNGNGTNPKTGDQYLLVPIVLFTASLGSLMYFFIKKYGIHLRNK